MDSVALDYISIQGFKSIASIQKLTLRPINVLIGANGSGKSNFIGAFSFLQFIREGRLQQYVREAGGAEQILHYGSKQTKQLDLHVSFRAEVNQYRIILRPTNDDSLYPSYEAAYYWDKSRGFSSPLEIPLQPENGGREAGISKPNLQRIPGWVQARLGLLRLYHVHDTSTSSPMRKTAQLNDNAFLKPDGSNLAAFLYLLKEKHSASYQLIQKTVRRVAPFFDDFVLTPDPLNEGTIRLAWKHVSSDSYFGASSLSDGSLRFIALAILFLQPEQFKPAVILVDEPELGLHPYAITLLASLVKQASTSTQVILSTQSGLLLDQFDPEDVLVAERRGGSTELRRLDPASLESWLVDYSLGQLWEKNELGGRPA